MLVIILGIIVAVLLLALWGAYRVVEKMSKEIELLRGVKTVINPIIDKREVTTLHSATLVENRNLLSRSMSEIVIERALRENLNRLVEEIKPYVEVRTTEEIGGKTLVETILTVVAK